jgi:hypothetical protein
MKITSDLSPVNPTEGGSTTTAPAPQVHPQEPSAAVASPPSPPDQPSTEDQGLASQQLNVGFRKDWDGRTYYVVTESQSGQIVREVPPEDLRRVSRGIEEYLKSQDSSAHPKIDTKA